MMNVIRFLLEYTVQEVYNGNKSQCARDLGMSYNYFSKLYRRTANGSCSVRIVEDLLLLYMRKKISIDECLREYTSSQRGKAIEDQEAPCVQVFQRIQGDISRTQTEAQNVTDLMRAATRMGDQMQKVFCADIPDCTLGCTENCPIAAFGIFIMELKRQIGFHVNERLLEQLQESRREQDKNPENREKTADATA